MMNSDSGGCSSVFFTLQSSVTKTYYNITYNIAFQQYNCKIEKKNRAAGSRLPVVEVGGGRQPGSFASVDRHSDSDA